LGLAIGQFPSLGISVTHEPHGRLHQLVLNFGRAHEGRVKLAEKPISEWAAAAVEPLTDWPTDADTAGFIGKPAATR
jgi:hypothetical protein